MRTFVLSDIHGNNKLFRKALKLVKLKRDDELIIIGDLIDRGFDSKGVLDTVFLLRDHGFNIKCLMGNHEQLFLKALNDEQYLNKWMLNGGDATLNSFLTSSINKVPAKYIDLIKDFDFYYESMEYIFVHAALNMKIENPYSDIHKILWEREPEKYLDDAWLDGRILIHGHTPTRKSIIKDSILKRNKIICVDNGTFMKQKEYGSQCILQLDNLKMLFVDENS